MGAFDDAIAAAAAIWYGADMAEALTYNGAAILGHVERTGGDAGSRVARQTAKLHVSKSAVPAPAYRDTVIDSGGTVWHVIRPIPENETPVDFTLNIEAGVSPVPGR